MTLPTVLSDCGVVLRAGEPISDWVRACAETYEADTAHLSSINDKLAVLFNKLNAVFATNLPGLNFVYGEGYEGYKCPPGRVPTPHSAHLNVYSIIQQARQHVYEKNRADAAAAASAALAAARAAEAERHRIEGIRRREKAAADAMEREVVRRATAILDAERAAVREAEINRRVAERLEQMRAAAAITTVAAPERAPVVAGPALPPGFERHQVVYGPALPATF